MQHEHIVLSEHSETLLYQQQAPAILAYLYKQTASWEDAEDLLVEVFLAALEHERFATLGEKDQVSWLWRVTRNKVADYYRRFKRRPSFQLDQEVAEAIYEDDEATPEQSLLQREEYIDLHKVVNTLPKTQQILLELRYGHGLNYTQIAAVLEKKEGAVRAQLSRTLKQLRNIYTSLRR